MGNAVALRQGGNFQILDLILLQLLLLAAQGHLVLGQPILNLQILLPKSLICLPLVGQISR